MSYGLLPDEVLALAARVIATNTAAGRTIVLAESCTGGLVAAALTEIAGSSVVLDRGFVTYSNLAKQEMLGVPADVLESFGAVSTATARAMARGALARSRADVAIAITGIAGPGGGSADKPVGTVVFARLRRARVLSDIDERLFEENGRAGVRLQATLFALALLLP